MLHLPFFLIFLFISINILQAHMIHHDVHTSIPKTTSYTFHQDSIPPFHELIISWNARRPEEGHYRLYVRVLTDTWSPWLHYCTWGTSHQYGAKLEKKKDGNDDVASEEDTILVKNGKCGRQFEILVVGEDGAFIDHFYTIHVASNTLPYTPKNIPIASRFISLSVKGISQIALPDTRNMRMCSPASTTSVIRYLTGENTTLPLSFADHVWDSKNDIYGNWVLNTAQASTCLGKEWDVWVERLEGFQDIILRLSEGTPVVISIRGPLPGSAMPYQSGHLIVVTGYDPEKNHVICMDPAFSEDTSTHVRYNLQDLMEAWSRRGNIAYIFSKKRIHNTFQ